MTSDPGSLYYPPTFSAHHHSLSSVPKSAYHQYASLAAPSNHQLLPDGECAHVCKGSLLQLLHAQVLPIHHLLDQRQQTTPKSLCAGQSLLPAGQRVAAKLAGGGDGDDVQEAGELAQEGADEGTGLPGTRRPLSLLERVAWRRRQTALLSHYELCLHWQEVPMRSGS